MRRWPGTAVLLLAVLAGCSTFPYPFAPSDAQVRGWVDQEQYGRALRALERRPPNEQTRQLLAEVQAQADAYDHQMAVEVRRLQERGDWKAAVALLNEGLMRYRGGDQLAAAGKALHRTQARRLERLRADLLASKGDWLAASIPLYRAIVATDPEDTESAWEAERLDKASKQTAQELTKLGLQALSRHELDRADRYLSLSQRLEPSERAQRAQERLASLRAQQKQRQQEADELSRRQRAEQLRQERKERQTRRVRTLTEEARVALRAADLPRARAALSQLRELDADAPQVSHLKQSLDQALEARLSELVDRANQYYADGKITRAKQVWEQALELDPANEALRGRVQRAERVLDNLREIQRRSADTQPDRGSTVDSRQ